MSRWMLLLNTVVSVAVVTVSSATARATQARPGQAVFEGPDIRVDVKVTSSIYTYRVTNLRPDPIVAFKVETAGAFAIVPPTDWDKELSPGILVAAVADAQQGIAPNTTEAFDLISIGRGSVLGRAPVHVRFESGQWAALENVWVPVKEPPAHGLIVVSLLLLILLAHAAIVTAKDRRAGKTPLSGR